MSTSSEPAAGGAALSADHRAIRTGRFVPASGGVRLHVAEAGDADAPPMLLLHGFPEYWGAWQPVMGQLARTHRVVAPDQRGYNLSDKPPGVQSYAPRALAADVVALLDALQAGPGGDLPAGSHAGRVAQADGVPASAAPRRCVLVAHDWGGAVAWGVAMRHPERLAGLVILNAPHPWKFWQALAGDPVQQHASAYMNWLRRPGSEAVLAQGDFARLERFFVGPGGAAWFTPPVRAAYHAAWSQPGALEASVNWYRASPLHPPQPGEPGAAGFTLDAAQFVVRVPTLVIWGGRDAALPAALADGLDAFVPDLTLERLPECTHWLVHEQPDWIARRIAAFAAALPERHGA